MVFEWVSLVLLSEVVLLDGMISINLSVMGWVF